MSLINSTFAKLKRPIQRNSYVPEIDVLRFFAIISVMLLHLSTSILDDIDSLNRTHFDSYNLARATILNRFGLGVDLFFAISGFVIARPFIGGKDINIKKYFVRRFIRIEPPYILALLVFATVHLLVGSYSKIEVSQHLLASLLYLHNALYDTWSSILPVAWSLEVEFQFYVLAPVFFLLLFKISRNWQIIILTLILCISFNLPGLGWKNITSYYGLFVIGILAAYPYHYLPIKRHFIFDSIMVVSLIMLFFIDFGKVATNIAILLIMLTFNRLHLLRKLFASTLLSTIGAATYTLYLLHYPLFKLINSIVNIFIKSDNFNLIFALEIISVLPLSVAFMFIYYYFVEKYFMSLSQKYR